MPSPIPISPQVIPTKPGPLQHSLNKVHRYTNLQSGPNIIEDDNDNAPTIHPRLHPTHYIIPPDTPKSPRVSRVQPPKVSDDSHIYNLRSRYALAAHAIQIIKSINCLGANLVMNITTKKAEEYRHLIKGDNKVTWIRSFSN